MKQLLQFLSGVMVAGIGAFLVYTGAAWSAPFCSGIAFVILGLNLWINNCYILHGCIGGSCNSKK